MRKSQKLRNNEYYNTQWVFDDLYDKSKKGQNFKKLLPLITSEQNILLAYRNIKRNKGSQTKGTNATTIRDLEKLKTNEIIEMVRNKLDDYKPGSVRRVMIEKDNGKLRPLGIPTMEDRLIQQCIKQILEPICEAKFHNHSYGFRSNRSQHHALSRCVSLINMTGLHYVVDIDIKGFFDNVNHNKLMKQLWTLGIRDKNLLCILSKMLKAEIKGEGNPTKGTPQGGILSPLLSNIVLNELDWWISDQWETFETKRNYSALRKGVYNEADSRASKFANLKRASNLKECFIVRYADDFKIFCRSFETAQKMFIATKQWLNERLKLEVSPEKSKVINLKKKSSDFLGFQIKATPKGSTRHGRVAETRMNKKTRQKTAKLARQKIIAIKKERRELSVTNYNSFVLGVHNYFKIGTHVTKDFSEIDFNIRKTIHNRLKTKAKINAPPSESFERFYKGYTGKTYSVSKVTLYPISYVKHENPRNFTQETCDYTVSGRKKIHDNQKSVSQRIIKYMAQHPIEDESVEFNDNRIALYVAQKGKCSVTGEFLTIGDMECHHKLPKFLGGNDKYDNLVLLKTVVHKIIHAEKEATIEALLKSFPLTKKQINKINKLRKVIGYGDI